MAKGASKSSASSATRKKHARKAVGKDDPLTDVPNVPKGKDKSKNKEPPRKKAYVPPVKPQAVQQDPIDALGLAQRLPAALLVVWRGLSKKDTVTKSKALEELRAGWIDRMHVLSNDDHDNQDIEDLARLEALIVSIPVWVRPSTRCGCGSILIFFFLAGILAQMYHVPALFLHPSRRLRSLAIAVQSDFLRAEPLRVQILFYLREVASAEQVECILGSWCMATRDPERLVALAAQRCWDPHVSVAPADKEGGEDRKFMLDAAQMAALFAFVQRALLDPLALHAYLNPVQVPVDVGVPKTIRGRPVPVVPAAAQAQRANREPPTRAKGESEEESDVDRRARLRIGALGVLQWILGTRLLQLFYVSLFSGVRRCSRSGTWTPVTR